MSVSVSWSSVPAMGRAPVLGATRMRSGVAPRRSRVAKTHRPWIGRRIAWRRLAVVAGDVLMVSLWAAMVPGFMWLGTAAGF